MYVIGFLAQLFFSARIIVQWILSERSKRIVSPTIFWILSLIGSYLLFIYGWMRNDFSIIFGQLISYYIYIWNLNAKGKWKNIFWCIRFILLITPFIVIGIMIENAQDFVRHFFQQKNIPVWLIIMGSAGQLIFTLRFVYQWFFSFKRHESILPVGFWLISLFGSGIIVAYALIRLDPVLIFGQSIGFIAYSRNIIIGYKSNRA